jgi:hypothetical protein
MSIHEYKILQQDKQNEMDNSDDVELIDPDSLVEPQEPPEDRSLEEIHFGIVENFNALVKSFAMDLIGPYSTYTFLAGFEQSAILESAIYFDPVKTDTLTIFSELSEKVLETELISLFRKAMTERNRRIEIVIGDVDSKSQLDLAHELYDRISHPSLLIFQTKRPLPFGGLVLEPYMAVGSFHPLRDRAFPYHNNGFTYVMKNVKVAKSMLQIKQRAKKILHDENTIS